VALATRADQPIEADHSLSGFLYVAASSDAELPPQNVATEAHAAGVRERVTLIRTCGDGRDYFGPGTPGLRVWV
jgi:hypothetical protein